MRNKLKEIEEYRSNPAVSQSKLKEYLGMTPPSQSTAFKGSLVDGLLTMNEHVDDMFIIGNDDYPDQSSVTYKMVDYMVNNEMAFSDENILEVYELFEHQQRWKSDTKIKNFEQYYDFYEFMKLKEDKTVVSEADFAHATNIVERLKEYIPDNVEFQVPIYNELHGIMCKGLIDFVDKSDTEFVIWDLKVLSVKVRDIKYSLRKMRTDFQLSFYRDILGTKALPKVLVYSNIDNDIAVYEMTDMDMEIGKWGFSKRHFMEVNNGSDISFAYDTVVHGYHDALNMYAGVYKHKKQETLWM